jgi:arabinogalactan endo-1,4-beta-galactosidase
VLDREGGLLRSRRESGDFILGVDANYHLEMRERGAAWRLDGRSIDLYPCLADQGVGWLRLRVLTGKHGPGGLRYAVRTARAAHDAGLELFVCLFLSDVFAAAMHQPAPRCWRGLGSERLLRAVRRSVRSTIAALGRAGLRPSLFQIGNEIDYGICGAYIDSTESRRENPWWMREHGSWRQAARIIRAAGDALRDCLPEARLVLHSAHWCNEAFSTGLFHSMREYGVDFDLVACSFHPSSGSSMIHFGIPNSFEEFERYVSAVTVELQCDLLVAECSYPSHSRIVGERSRWRYEASGYPFSEHSQWRWIEDLSQLCREHPRVAGVFYWSPELYSHDGWEPFALFGPDGAAKPALDALRLR